MLRDIQQRFRRAVTVGDDAGLLAIMDRGLPAHITPARRIAVHRNTYFGSLTEALEAAFPVCQALVGQAFFRVAARAFIETDPPRRPDLAAYGAGFGHFLGNFPPAVGVPYLEDIARLEWARVEATFAAEAESLAPAALAGVPPERVAGLRLLPHPSLRLVESPWSIQDIWDAHQCDPVRPFNPDGGGERVMVLRPSGQMLARRLSVGEAVLVTALVGRVQLGRAATQALTAEPALNLQVALAGLLGDGAVVGFEDEGNDDDPATE